MLEQAVETAPRIRSCERVVLAIRGRARVAGFATTARDEGAQGCVREIAATSAWSGISTVLLDLDAPDRIATGATLSGLGDGALRLWVSRDADGFDAIRPERTQAARFRLNDAVLLREIFAQLAATYDCVLVALPPLDRHGASEAGINGLAAASACDAVFLICRPGEERKGVLTDAVEQLHSVGAKPAGLVLDESRFTPVAQEVARFCRVLSIVSRRLARYAARKAAQSPLLN